MGQFSWITQDTEQSIRNNVSDYKAQAYMHDNNGNVWEEKEYEGYGEFGGKDFYELLAEMNGVTLTEEEINNHTYGETRDEKYTDIMRGKGIDIYFGDEPFISPNLTRRKKWTWVNRAPIDCPNQGWEDYK